MEFGGDATANFDTILRARSSRFPLFLFPLHFTVSSLTQLTPTFVSLSQQVYHEQSLIPSCKGSLRTLQIFDMSGLSSPSSWLTLQTHQRSVNVSHTIRLSEIIINRRRHTRRRRRSLSSHPTSTLHLSRSHLALDSPRSFRNISLTLLSLHCLQLLSIIVS